MNNDATVNAHFIVFSFVVIFLLIIEIWYIKRKPTRHIIPIQYTVKTINRVRYSVFLALAFNDVKPTKNAWIFVKTRKKKNKW